MDFVDVGGSHLRQVGWEDDTLHVRFKYGGRYTYHGVPYSVYQDLLAAKSPGKFFISKVRDKFRWVKIDENGNPERGMSRDV